MLKSIWKHHARQARSRARQGKAPFYDLATNLEQVHRPPDAARPERETWNADQLAAFLGEAKRVYDTGPISLLYPLFHNAIAAGLRRGELPGPRRSALVTVVDAQWNPWHQLTVDAQYTYYGGKHRRASPKSAAGIRRVPIGPELAEVLKGHMARVDETTERVM